MEIRQFRVVVRAKSFERTCRFYGETLSLGGAGAFAILAAICGAVAARTFKFRPMILEKTVQQIEHDRQKVDGAP